MRRFILSQRRKEKKGYFANGVGRVAKLDLESGEEEVEADDLS